MPTFMGVIEGVLGCGFRVIGGDMKSSGCGVRARAWLISGLLGLAGALAPLKATAATVTFSLPTKTQGVKRIHDRYAGKWRWTRMDCETSDTCYNFETRKGHHCSGLLRLESYVIDGRPDGVSPYFRPIAFGTAVGLEGNSLTVELPPMTGQWTLYARTQSMDGSWSCASNKLVRIFQ